MLLKSIMVVIFLATSSLALEKEEISSTMKSRIESTINIISQKELSIDEKTKKIFPLFDQIFDYQLMTKLSLGKMNWSQMTTKQREEFSKIFILHLKKAYLVKISLYTDEKLNIVKLKEINKKRVWLLTELVGSSDTYDITYKFYKSKNRGWLIYDVDIMGISLIKIYKVQFNNLLQNESYEMLLEKIRVK
ncbi:MAG: ABC transporter substrate-binding protein [Sulfurospirillum sp.]|nr:ABC transporter substrate-binding protein [Sulfurospirillum sp.]